MDVAMSGELWTSVLAIVGIGGFGAVVSYLHSRRLLDVDDHDEAFRRLIRRWMFAFLLTGLVAGIVLGETGWFGLIEQNLARLPIGGALGTRALVLFVQVLGPLLVAILVSLGFYPIDRSIRRQGPSTPVWVIEQVGSVVLDLLRLLVPVVVLVLAGVVLPDTVAYIVAVLVAVLVVVAAQPLLVRVESSTRAPTDEERTRLATICEELDLDVARTRVLRLRGYSIVVAELLGVPGRRHLLVTERFFEEADRIQRASFGIAIGFARTFHFGIYYGLAFIAIVGMTSVAVDAAPTPPIPELQFAVGTVVLCFAGVWLGQYLVYRADDIAARATDPTAVADVIERQYIDQNVPLEWSRVRRITWMQPSPKQRIERLRARAED